MATASQPPPAARIERAVRVLTDTDHQAASVERPPRERHRAQWVVGTVARCGGRPVTGKVGHHPTLRCGGPPGRSRLLGAEVVEDDDTAHGPTSSRNASMWAIVASGSSMWT